ncbi:flagellar biogenesis protein FliO [Chryseomicrobium aureum]|uniref:hypothetical protein n=1 Tax=Chryseomicrobium aureum TaxID=1441723 RepID=UPI00195B7652|nr:hypothetical protein [Chryseomicrobium aureum]MBM7707140.1 flagellar biogenesis protein FliO [Chryseomicrobium aureum]
MQGITTVGFGLFGLFYLVFVLAIVGFVIWFMVQLIQTQRAKVRVLEEISMKLDRPKSTRDNF